MLVPENEMGGSLLKVEFPFVIWVMLCGLDGANNIRFTRINLALVSGLYMNVAKCAVVRLCGVR